MASHHPSLSLHHRSSSINHLSSIIHHPSIGDHHPSPIIYHREESKNGPPVRLPTWSRKKNLHASGANSPKSCPGFFSNDLGSRIKISEHPWGRSNRFFEPDLFRSVPGCPKLQIFSRSRIISLLISYTIKSPIATW